MDAHDTKLPVRGRGALDNPANRFETVEFVVDPELGPEDRPAPETMFLRDTTRSVLVENTSPDIPFEVSLNPYRGCEHGCVYCFARPTHEYLGFSAGLDFESRIMVKQDAPELLRAELARPRYRVRPIAIGTVTDCYQPAERVFRITRRCLEVLAEHRHPVGFVTKSQLVTRDVDVLQELAREGCARVWVSVTTLDRELAARLEPRAPGPRSRLETIAALAAAGVPVGVMAAPMIPGLTDEELPAILAAAREAGARWAGYVMLRLPHGVAGLFEDWLRVHAPGRAAKVLNRVRGMRGGALNDSRFGTRFRGEGPFAELLGKVFHARAAALGFEAEAPELARDRFRPPGGTQLRLFPGAGSA